MTDSLRFRHVVYRNYRVWRKLLLASIVGHLLDPLFWLVGLGFGLGSLLPTVSGIPYLEFLGSGMICYGVMYSASFEALWSAFARLKQQRTWEGILHAPMTVTDIVIGEWVWAALKGMLSGVAIFAVMVALGLVHGFAALWVLPVMLLTGLAFAGLALVITALARSYDHFVYYFTLFITPMMLVSGVFLSDRAVAARRAGGCTDPAAVACHAARAGAGARSARGRRCDAHRGPGAHRAHRCLHCPQARREALALSAAGCEPETLLGWVAFLALSSQLVAHSPSPQPCRRNPAQTLTP